MSTYRHMSLFVLIFVASCGGNGSTDSSFREDRIEANCAKAHECRDVYIQQKTEEGMTSVEAEALFDQSFGQSVSDCKEISEQQIDQDYEEKLAAALAQGTVTFSPDLAKKCLDAINDSTCALFVTSDISGVCGDEEIYTGTKNNDEACTIDLECAEPGAWCVADSNTCTSN